MVHHWMDHPPLYSLLVGGWVWLLGDRRLQDVSAVQVRVVPVLCSTLTIPLLHLLARSVVGRAPGLLSAALLATAPAAVLLGRESEPESAQAVLLLLALLATWRLLHGGGIGRWVAVLVACALLAPAMKVSGIAVGVICGVILLAERRLWLAVWAGAGLLGGLAIYVLYGALTDWTLFLQVVLSQSQNRLDVLTAIAFFADPTGVNRSLHDGWWLLGWLGLGVCALVGGRRQRLFLVWPAAAYAATILILAGTKQTAQYGWYKVIVYPELYLAAGILAWTALRRSSLGLLTLLLVLGGATATNWWFAGPTGGWVPNPILLVVLLVLTLGPAALTRWGARWRTLARWVGGVAMSVLLVGNATESWILSMIFTRM
jgi:4-amino-4-deoxy-L-arabinose transferase-like glycosyltransferase